MSSGELLWWCQTEFLRKKCLVNASEYSNKKIKVIILIVSNILYIYTWINAENLHDLGFWLILFGGGYFSPLPAWFWHLPVCVGWPHLLSLTLKRGSFLTNCHIPDPSPRGGLSCLGLCWVSMRDLLHLSCTSNPLCFVKTGWGFNNLSQVCMARHTPSGRLVAVKRTNLDRCTEDELLQLLVSWLPLAGCSLGGGNICPCFSNQQA